MLSPSSLIKIIVSKILPAKNPDSAQIDIPIRGMSYGEVAVIEPNRGEHPATEEGSCFTVQNPVPGTALAAPVISSFLDTSALYAIFNGADITQPFPKSILLKHLKEMYTVAPATATGKRYLVKLDTKDRTPTAGFVLLAGQTGGPTPGATQPGPIIGASIARIYAFTGGAQMTVPAAGSTARVVATGGVDGIPVVGGERVIKFGAADMPSSAQGSIANAVVIPPGCWAVIHEWFPGNATTGASLEPEITWLER